MNIWNWGYFPNGDEDEDRNERLSTNDNARGRLREKNHRKEDEVSYG
jgi:hypothetical protein